MANTTIRYLQYLFPAIQGDEVCTVQSGQANTPLSLNGTLKDRSGANQISFIQDGYSRSLGFKCDDNLANVVFNVTGTENGVSVTENIEGVSQNKTVYSKNCYDIVTSIVPNRIFNGSLSVGSGTKGWILITMDPYLTSSSALQVIALTQGNSLSNGVLSSLSKVFDCGISINDLIQTNIKDNKLDLLPNSFFGIFAAPTTNMTYFERSFGGFFSILLVLGFSGEENDGKTPENGYQVLFSQV